MAALEAACPGLEAALRDAGVAANLPDGWRESLRPDALRDIATLEQRYLQPASQAPDGGGLQAILEQLASEQIKPPQSWWDMAMAWLRSWFSTPEEGSGSWLDALLERLGQWRDLITVMTYVLLAVAVIGALAFIFNELRVAGVLSRRMPPASRGLAEAPWEDATAGPGDLDAAALADQPAILLRQLVAQLAARGILTTERSLTHRELVARARLPDTESQTRFARVSQLAERVLYGHGTMDDGQVRDVLIDGRHLLQQLQAATDARP